MIGEAAADGKSAGSTGFCQDLKAPLPMFGLAIVREWRPVNGLLTLTMSG